MEGSTRTESPASPLGAIHSAHLVGVCGAGMKALAELLDGLGWRISGSDLQPAGASIYALALHGMRFSQDHAPENVPNGTECLIYSPAIPVGNPERAEAKRRGIPQWSYSEMVGALMESRTGLCVAGTHGKSTCTAMIGWILSVAGLDPAVLVGAELCDSGHSGRAGASGLMVVESCEFNHSFLDFLPAHAVILSIEPDHFDCYADLTSLRAAFREFAMRIPCDGTLLANADCESTRWAVQDLPSRLVTFGIDSPADWQASQIVDRPEGLHFELVRGGRPWARVELRLHGRHNAQNALAAAAICAEIGVSEKDIIAGLGSFGGIKRRFEVVGERNGITRIDDYAHHPTAVRATLQTCRQVYGDRHIWCAFQPHQVSRTVALMADFAASFDDADDVLVLPAFAAREHVTNEPALVSRELANRIVARGRRARFLESLDQINPTVDDAARPGDVLIAMGAGDIDRINHEFT